MASVINSIITNSAAIISILSCAEPAAMVFDPALDKPVVELEADMGLAELATGVVFDPATMDEVKEVEATPATNAEAVLIPAIKAATKAVPMVQQATKAATLTAAKPRVESTVV